LTWASVQALQLIATLKAFQDCLTIQQRRPEMTPENFFQKNIQVSFFSAHSSDELEYLSSLSNASA